MALRCRVTIAMPGTRPGHIVLVDPSDPHIAMCLREGYLVPTADQDGGLGDNVLPPEGKETP